MKQIALWVVAVAAVVGGTVEASAQTAITGATVHPIDGEPIEDGVVLIGEDGRIEAVGGDVDVPDGAEVVDASGDVVTPGLIDARTRVGVVEIWAVDSTRDVARGGESPIRAAFRVADGFDPSSGVIPVARTGGVTSTVVVPAGGVVSGQSGWADLGGAERGYARLVDESVGLHFEYGAQWPDPPFRSRGGVMEKFRELYDDVRFYQNNREAFDENRSRDLTASRLDLEALVATLDDGGMPAVFNTHRASDIVSVLEFAAEQGLEPVVTGALEGWKVADKLAERDVPVVVNPVNNLPTRFETLGARLDNAAIMAEAGVPVVLSTFNTHNVRKLRQLAGNAVRAGMPHEKALEAVTQNPARAFGMADEYGSLTPGKVANVVVWSGDPFEFSSHVEQMYVHGEQVSTENRQTALFERYENLERRGEPAPKNGPETDESGDSESEATEEE
jgi:imidazolonepropionase-like amidohydrolase